MKKLAIFALLTILALPAHAFAESNKLGIYIAPKVIGSVVSTEESLHSPDLSLLLSDYSDSLAGASLAVGYNFSPIFHLPFRAEAEYSLYGDIKEITSLIDEDSSGDIMGKIDLSTLFLNVYLDFENSSPFTPYLGAGIGFAFVGMQGSISNILDEEEVSNAISFGKNTDTNFAWNVGLGLTYDFSNSFSLDLGYRYVHFGDIITGNASGTDVEENSILKSKNIDAHQLTLGVRFTF